MTDVTGALLSRQVRREIERKKSKNAVLTVKPDYLKDLCSQAVAKEAGVRFKHPSGSLNHGRHRIQDWE